MEFLEQAGLIGKTKESDFQMICISIQEFLFFV